jgi:hypothetical protein
MQSKTGKAKVQDGGERHLENQLYVMTTVFMGRFHSNFYHSAVPPSRVRKCNQIQDKKNSRWRRRYGELITSAPYQLLVERIIKTGIGKNPRWLKL